MCEDVGESCYVGMASERILSLAGGRQPVSLSDWLHVAGRLGVGVMSVKRLGFRGGMARGLILLPDDGDDGECAATCAHEVGEYLVRRMAHQDARRIEHQFVPDGLLPGDPLDDAPAREARKAKQAKVPEKVLPRRV
jgi:hypothetical protein